MSNYEQPPRTSQNSAFLLKIDRIFQKKKKKIFEEYRTSDLSIGSNETKYIKLNTKTQNIFCCVNENLTTFLCTLTGGTRKQKEKKGFLFESVYKS
jgi:hypothetical protein